MIALSVALVILGGLAYDLVRRALDLRKIVPPHEDLLRRVALLETKTDAMMSRTGFEVIK